MIILFLISLLICIITHELGHLFAAKYCGCGVQTFSIGFWKPILWSKKIGGTVYQLTPWILGGFCGLKDELTASKSKTSFSNLPYLKKVLISLAGCGVNLGLGLLAFGLGYYFKNYCLLYFGFLSIVLGLTNALPVASCLDGGYVVYLPIYLKFYGNKKGTLLFEKSVRSSFRILMILNILMIPLAIYLYLFYKGVL
jgi:membrane-associated protease RseP (regulator of RpoE activity)